MKFAIVKGESSVILTVFIQDSSSTTGAGLGSLDQASGITGGYVKRDGTGVALAVNENVTTEGTYESPSTAAQVRIGTPANMITGVYEFHFHNDLFTTADWVTMSFSGASNMAPLLLEIQLTSLNLNSPTVESDLVKIKGTALTETAGQLAARFKDFFDQDAAGFNIKTALSAFKATGFAPANEYDTQLDANMSSRAPSGEYDTELDTTISSRAPASEYDTEMGRITGNVALDSTVSKEATAAKDATVAKAATVALDSTVAKDATVALDATVAKAATVALDSTVAKDATVSKFDPDNDEVDLGKIKGTALASEVAAGSLANNFRQFFNVNPVSSQDIDDVGAGGGGGGDATESNQNTIIDLLEADSEIKDDNPAQHQRVMTKKGTATVLVTKDLFKPDGDPVTSISDVISQEVEA